MTNNNLYANKSARLDTVVGSNEYFILLNKIRINGPTDLNEFYQYLIDNCGIRMMFDSNGRITEEYEIDDEQKYLMTVLKYK